MNNDNKSLGETLLVIEHTRLHQNSMEFSGGSGGAGGCGGSGGCGGGGGCSGGSGGGNSATNKVA
ncbi:hypothetical protein D3C76_1719830 [compost metagenome]